MSQNLQENVCAGATFLIKFSTTLFKNRLQNRWFSVNFAIFKNTFLGHLYVTSYEEFE